MTSFAEQLTIVIKENASDLYILPRENGYQLLMAKKGQIVILRKISEEYGQHFISYLKYRADMAVSEHRRPQLGAFNLVCEGRKVNLRLSTVGDYQGRESLVVRFIYQVIDTQFNFLVPRHWEVLKNCCQQRGLILFAGPMGAGKTTTMYQLARAMLPDKVVLTIEDPVEIEEPGFIQLQVNDLAGMNYQSLLKVGLRHRPNIFIVGEIRDAQTAAMTIQAALSGHLVLGTIHAQNAGGVIARLRQLGVDRYYLQQVLTAISYQRLLPLRNGEQAILCDLLYQEYLINSIMNNGERGMSDERTKNLKSAVAKGKITSEVAEEFRKG